LYDRILIELNSPLGSTLKRSSSASAMGLGCVKTRSRSIAIEEVIRPRPF